jgi:hypothetical protein
MNKKPEGDFNYNGIPIFNVGFLDFSMILNCFESDKRIYTKNIYKENLREYYKNTREKKFGICYEGVILDSRSFNSKND